ncbi:GON-4-like protein [Halichondria panicea]|uniref:GON-4-like protein n=1 Tax=Halichondria panicea TaxID=6063 RepID=UPI00312B69BE
MADEDEVLNALSEAGSADDEGIDVDTVIQNAAEKANLSILNVKSILHHVLKDKRVLSVIQREAGEGSEVMDDDIIQPRLTRSKVREAVATTMSPDKITRMRAITRSPTKPGCMSVEELLNVSLGTEDSSDDEEYLPEGAEHSEGAGHSDSEGVGHSDSDSEDPGCTEDTERDPTLSPLSVDTPPSQSLGGVSVEQETAALLASLSDVILSPIKTRGQRSQEQQQASEIARRTRSKFPLIDTPLSAIEGSFQPSDPDDPPTPREMDPDDLEWHQWLNDLMNPPESALEEVEEDGEYNYLAESDVVEKEELRNDRAVKIPRKEVDQLVNELLYPPSEGLGGLLSGHGGMDLTSAYLLESLGLPAPLLSGSEDRETTPTDEGVGCYLSLDQAQTLSQQIRQHFQLLMQTLLLCRCEPSLLLLSQVANQAIDELHIWSEGAWQGTHSAVWYIPDMSGGIELIQQLESIGNEQPVTMAASSRPRTSIPYIAQEKLMTTPLFWTDPSLLPAVGFAPMTEGKSTPPSSFSSAEDCLLVFGMDHYGSAAWQDIRTNLLPVKTIKQLQLRVKNQCSKRTGNNVVKHYKKTKQLKIPFSQAEEKALPHWVTLYHKKRVEKEKEAKKKSEELCKQTAKLKKMLGLVPQRRAEEGGSKQNLITCMEEVTNNDKKPRVETPNDDRKLTVGNHRRLRRRKTKMKQGVRVCDEQGQSSLHHLLLAAGLQPSDANARFAHSFISEVKTTLPSDGVKYDQFLNLLSTADHQHWTPAKLYGEVSLVLESWPYLVRLFTELLSDRDCLLANAMGYRMEVTGVREFAGKLKECFANSPLSLSAVLDALHQLDTPTLTNDKVETALLPLVTAHEKLVTALRRFLYQLTPSHGGVFEEVDLSQSPDTFETISQSQLTATMATKSCVTTPTPSPGPAAPWTRRDDGVILKACMGVESGVSLVRVWGDVANTLDRTQHEVKERYLNLLHLMQSTKLSQ